MLKKRYDMNPDQDPLRGGGPATEAPVHRMKLFGIRNPEGMSKWGASKLIDKLMKRDSKGMASIQQLRRLLAAGVSEEQARGMSRRDASQVIGTLIESNPLTQGTFF